MLESPSSEWGWWFGVFCTLPTRLCQWHQPRLTQRSGIDLLPFIRASVHSDCNHTSCSCLTPSLLCNLQSAVELQGCLTQREIILTSPFSLPLWLSLLLADCCIHPPHHNHVRNLSMIPEWDKLTLEQQPGSPTTSTFQPAVLICFSQISLWKCCDCINAAFFFTSFTCSQCSSSTLVWCFRLIINSNNQHLSTTSATAIH